MSPVINVRSLLEVSPVIAQVILTVMDVKFVSFKLRVQTNEQSSDFIVTNGQYVQGFKSECISPNIFRKIKFTV